MISIAVAGDHAGYEFKKRLTEYLAERGFRVADLGTYSDAAVDYADYAYPVADGVADGTYTFGILICGTGIGMSLAAGRVRNIRAAVCTNEFMAEAARAHNDANILCLGARVVGYEDAVRITDKFLTTAFEGGRHAVRIGKIR